MSIRTATAVSVLFIPTCLTPIAKRLIPGWYDPVMAALSFLLLIQAIAAIYLIYIVWLTWRKGKRSSARLVTSILGTAGAVLWICFAALMWFDAGTRDGIFLCGRDLVGTQACPGGGEVYTYWYTCIAGNLKIQYGVRRNMLPFMTIWNEPEDPSLLSWHTDSICDALASGR